MQQTLTLRLIYITVFIALSWPLINNYSLPPAKMEQGDKIYKIVESLELGSNGIALVSMDFGPSTIAENRPQTEVLIEHLMRGRKRFAVMTLYAQASSMLESIPQGVADRLMKELPGQKWEYGIDWVNLGFQPNGGLMLQSIAKSENLVETLKKDAQGTPLSELVAFREVRSFKDIKLLGQITGLVGMLNAYLQFFQREDHRPQFIHGCTSITIPDAYIYLDSGQLSGLFEGIAGAAWYTTLLSKAYPARDQGDALLMNTALGVAHIVLLALIILGNVIYFSKQFKKNREAAI